MSPCPRSTPPSAYATFLAPAALPRYPRTPANHPRNAPAPRAPLLPPSAPSARLSSPWTLARYPGKALAAFRAAPRSPRLQTPPAVRPRAPQSDLSKPRAGARPECPLPNPPASRNNRKSAAGIRSTAVRKTSSRPTLRGQHYTQAKTPPRNRTAAACRHVGRHPKMRLVLEGAITKCRQREEPTSRNLRWNSFHRFDDFLEFRRIMRANRNTEKESCALAGRRFRPHPPSVLADDALHGGQADAHALEFVLAVQPLEHAEKFIGVTRVESPAIIPNEDDVHPVFFQTS